MKFIVLFCAAFSCISIAESSLFSVCRYECPSGARPVPNPNHVSIVNGCGSKGLNLPQALLAHPKMQECCNTHDRCYDTCNMDKWKCEERFQKCLGDLCFQAIRDRYNNFWSAVLMALFPLGTAMEDTACLSQTRFLHETVSAYGCSSFLDAQKNSCMCL